MNKLVWSKYILEINLRDNDYMFNCKTGDLIKLKKFNLDDDKEGKQIKILKEKSFIVYENEDELKYMEEQNDIANKKVFNATIALTYNCNFNCSYCFVNKSTLSIINKENMEKIIKYLKSIYNQYEKFNIVWFGGEPLLAINEIKYMTDRITSFIEPNNLHSMVITNGYLLDINNYKILYNLGVNKIQITLDGNRERHNFFRKTRLGKESYDKIINNIKNIILLEEKIEIFIRINYSLEDVTWINGLIQELTDENIINNQFIKVYFAPIIDFGENKSFERYIISNDKKIDLSLDITSNKSKEDILPKPKYRWCHAGEKNNFIIDSNCNLFMCKSQLGNDKKIIGNLGNEKININYENKKNDLCLKCNIYPICLGECKVFDLPNKNYCRIKKDSVVKRVVQYIYYTL